MSLARALREALQASHDQIEQTPFAMALARGQVRTVDYTLALGQLRRIHGVLEEALGREPELAELFRPPMRRLAALDRDLEFWNVNLAELPCLAETDRLVEQLRVWSGRSAWHLLGALYVFEGSRMGSQVLVRPVAAALGVEPREGQGVDYHAEGAADQTRAWRAFKTQLDALILPSEHVAAVVAGACRAMDLLYDLYAVLPAAEVARTG
jgi:heme oxygenase